MELHRRDGAGGRGDVDGPRFAAETNLHDMKPGHDLDRRLRVDLVAVDGGRGAGGDVESDDPDLRLEVLDRLLRVPPRVGRRGSRRARPRDSAGAPRRDERAPAPSARSGRRPFPSAKASTTPRTSRARPPPCRPSRARGPPCRGPLRDASHRLRGCDECRGRHRGRRGDEGPPTSGRSQRHLLPRCTPSTLPEQDRRRTKPRPSTEREPSRAIGHAVE